jgi:hypothetical protein
MRFINKKTLPVTKYRKSAVDLHEFQLDNGMSVEIVDAPHGISTVYASTQISEHASIEAAKIFLNALNTVNVIEGSRVNFSLVRDFAENYSSIATL